MIHSGLTRNQDSMASEADNLNVGPEPPSVDLHGAPERAKKGRFLDGLSQSVRGKIARVKMYAIPAICILDNSLTVVSMPLQSRGEDPEERTCPFEPR